MSRKYVVSVEIEMPDDSDAYDAACWLGSCLDCLFEAPHPYSPKNITAVEVAQPAPRKNQWNPKLF